MAKARSKFLVFRLKDGFQRKMPECYPKLLNKMAGRKSTMHSELKNKNSKNRTKDKMMAGSSTKETHEETDR